MVWNLYRLLKKSAIQSWIERLAALHGRCRGLSSQVMCAVTVAIWRLSTGAQVGAVTDKVDRNSRKMP